MMASCIDRQDSPATPGSLTHHVVVRADLPRGVQAAQILHAAGESATPKPAPGTIAVALAATDEHQLRLVSDQLRAASIPHVQVHESADDRRYPGQMMALGLLPTTDRAAVRKVLGALPTVK